MPINKYTTKSIHIIFPLYHNCVKKSIYQYANQPLTNQFTAFFLCNCVKHGSVYDQVTITSKHGHV